MEKAAVEMGDVVKEMSDHMPECFLRDHILLAANVAITAVNDSAAIQAVIFFSQRNMRQCKILLKNKRY